MRLCCGRMEEGALAVWDHWNQIRHWNLQFQFMDLDQSIGIGKNNSGEKGICIFRSKSQKRRKSVLSCLETSVTLGNLMKAWHSRVVGGTHPIANIFKKWRCREFGFIASSPSGCQVAILSSCNLGKQVGTLGIRIRACSVILGARDFGDRIIVIMASMTELIYEDEATAWTSWTYSAFYDPTDHNDHQEVDPQYTQAAITRYMSRDLEIRCCKKCEHKLRATLANVQGVDRVLSTHNNKKLVVSGSADYDTIHNALKHVQKHHHHFTPGQRFHNPFRGLIHNHSRSRYTPSWNQQQAHTSTDTNNITPYESDGKYGPDYGQAPQHHYRPGSLRHLLFDSWRSSDHSNSGYTYYN